MRRNIIRIIGIIYILFAFSQIGCGVGNTTEKKEGVTTLTMKSSNENRDDIVWDNPFDMERYIIAILQEDDFMQLLSCMIHAESGEYNYDFYALPEDRCMKSDSTQKSCMILAETGELLKLLEQKTGRFNLGHAKVNQDKSVILWSNGFPTTMATFFVYDPNASMTVDEMASEVRHLMTLETISIQHKSIGKDAHLFFGNADDLSDSDYEFVYENFCGDTKQYDQIPYVGQRLFTFQCYWLSKGGDYKRLTGKQLEKELWEYIFFDEKQELFLQCIDADEGAQIKAFARYNFKGELIEWQGGTKPQKKRISE